MRVQPSLLTLLLASAAMAAQAADPNSAKAEAWAVDFKAADLNRSGGLSQAELGVTKPQQFADTKKGFARMDANRDGQLTVAEYVAHKEKQRQTWEAAFKKADVNDSGGLSLAELGKTPSSQFADLKTGFDKADLNRDAQVTVQEYTDFQSPAPDTSEDEDTGWASLLKKLF